jgi:hypothetical protein
MYRPVGCVWRFTSSGAWSGASLEVTCALQGFAFIKISSMQLLTVSVVIARDQR